MQLNKETSLNQQSSLTTFIHLTYPSGVHVQWPEFSQGGSFVALHKLFDYHIVERTFSWYGERLFHVRLVKVDLIQFCQSKLLGNLKKFHTSLLNEASSVYHDYRQEVLT